MIEGGVILECIIHMVHLFLQQDVLAPKGPYSVTITFGFALTNDDRFLQVLEGLERQLQLNNDAIQHQRSQNEQLTRRVKQLEQVQKEMPSTAQVQVRQGYRYGHHGKVTGYMEEITYTAYGSNGMKAARDIFQQWPLSLTDDGDDDQQKALK